MRDLRAKNKLLQHTQQRMRILNSIQRIDLQNEQLIEHLRVEEGVNQGRQLLYECPICLVDHPIEGCCTLPCGHRFCFESLKGNSGSKISSFSKSV